MAQQKNGPVIGLAVFMVLSAGLAFGLYVTSTSNGTLSSQLDKAKADLTARDATVRERNDQLSSLLQLAGVQGNIDPNETDVPALEAKLRQKLETLASDGTGSISDLEAGLVSATTDRDLERMTSTERLAMFNGKEAELNQTIASKDAEIKEHQDAREKAEEDLRKQEAKASEQLQQLETEVDRLRDENEALEGEYAAYRARTTREVEDLTQDNNDQRQALVSLRTALFEQEDLSFSQADGSVGFIDRARGKRGICYINLGRADELQVGSTFSVYTKSNSGVGRRNTEDVKGKIEVVDILGPHLAEARIVDEDATRSIAEDDPIYSPVFTSGQKLEIAVAGLINLDGKPGNDSGRSEFKRIVGASGTDITVLVNAKGEFTDFSGDVIGTQEARNRITEQTRFLVLGDTGEVDVESEDSGLKAAYKQINENTDILRQEAMNHGVYVISLGAFLEHLGYTRKQVAWTPGQPALGVLPNGARSRAVGAAGGGRESSAALSGAFSKRKLGAAASSGNNSAAYGGR